MIHRSTKNQEGFIALMSVIIIMAVLLVIGASISFTSFSSRFNVSDSEFKKRSSNLAEACVDAELLKLAQGTTYANGATVAVGSDSCTVFSVATAAGQTTIKTKAIFQQSVTNVQAVVNSTSLHLHSWQELPSL